MKICLVTHTMPRFKEDTNSASFISELAEGLVKEGNDVFVLTPFDPLFKKYKRPYKVITYKYIWPLSLHTGGYSRVFDKDNAMKPQMYIISILMSISALLHLIKVSRKYRIDVVSAHWAVPNGFIAYLASLVTGIPYTITIPGSDVYLAGKNWFFKFTTKLGALKAGIVISDSGHYLSQLHALGVYPKKTAIIRYGVNTNALRPTAKSLELLLKLGIVKNKKVILCLGRFVEKKGFIYAIEAMPTILKKIPNVVLIIAGGGELENKYREKVTKLKLTQNVVFPGRVPYQDRGKYYNLADIFIMPSIKDSKGNIDASPVAMMDAMACGIPVVATGYSGSSDLVIDGKTGYMVKEKSSLEIAHAVTGLLKQKNTQELKKSVRSIAVSHFSLKKTAKSYSRVFSNLV